MRYEEFVIIGGNNGLKDKVSGLSLKSGKVVKTITKEKGDVVIVVTHDNCLCHLSEELRKIFGPSNVMHQYGGAV